jgi:hypothetical protein
MARGNTTVKDGAGLGSPNFRSWHETDQPGRLTTSAFEGRPEVADVRANRRD